LNTDETDRVASLIKAAFAGVKLGSGVSIRQGCGLDDYADENTLAALRAQDEKDDWRSISAYDLNQHHWGLCFLDSAGMLFYAPAIMLADLSEQLDFSAVFHLTCIGTGTNDRFALFNDEQKTAVQSFLMLHLNKSMSGSPDDYSIWFALDNYWKWPPNY
jgi:hypothetical protein